MKKQRIEIRLTTEEVEELDKLAVKEGRSRKNLLEFTIKKLLK